jgi:hypothetical protein
MTIISFMVIGCASMQPLSNYARTGDTVAISLGGTDSNALVPVLKKENIAIIITDAANNVYPIKIRNVFRIYSDPTSIYSYSRGSVPPHMGQWMAIIDLVDPNSGQPPALAIGPATLSVSSPQIQNYVDYPGGGFPSGSGNLGAIPIQILAGTGSANPMNYESYVNVTPLDDLEPLPQVEISVAGTPSTLIGGGTFTFRYVTVDFNQNGRPQVTTTTPDPNVQLASNYVGQADGTTQLTVLITNPHGFNIDNRQTGLDVGRSLLRSLRFNIIWNNYTAITDSNWQQSLQLVSGQYFDLNGNVMSGISPVVTKVR